MQVCKETTLDRGKNYLKGLKETTSIHISYHWTGTGVSINQCGQFCWAELPLNGHDLTIINKHCLLHFMFFTTPLGNPLVQEIRFSRSQGIPCVL